ncbi:MAG: hypothetical protein EA398_01205 [Deltaproteobacteria bacterium]|nr:MAG: hypothetical protein EA398_01205 [Deltaproteobacteria bacterium]
MPLRRLNPSLLALLGTALVLTIVLAFAGWAAAGDDASEYCDFFGTPCSESALCDIGFYECEEFEDPGGTDPGGTDPGGTDPGGTDPGGTDPGGTDPDGTSAGLPDPTGGEQDSGTGSGAAPTGPADGSGLPGSDPGAAVGTGSDGCGCAASPGSGSGLPALFLLLGLLGLRRRR